MEIANVDKAFDEIKWLALAVGTDSTRGNLTRIHVDGTRAVATDGHRLHFIENTSLPAGFSLRGTDAARILDLAKDYALTNVQHWDGGTRWKFESPDGSCELVCSKGEYTFPDYRRVLPEGEAVEVKTQDTRKVFCGENGKVDFCAIGPGHFNARYIAEALRGAPKRVQVVLGTDDYAPILFTYADRGAVVMPLRK